MVKITIDLTGTIERLQAEQKAAEKPKKKAKASKPKDERAEELTLRLMAISGDSSDEGAVQLEMDTIAYVQEQLASGRKKQAMNFLNDNKHRFTPEMKDGLTDVINKGL